MEPTEHRPAAGLHNPRRPAPKPRFRGRFHQGAFIASIPLGLALVAVSSKLTARVATTIYALSVIGMYGTSAAYHRLPGRRTDSGGCGASTTP